MTDQPAEKPIPTPSPSFGVQLLRQFIEGNYFYVLSAFMMLGGCFMLMRSPVVAGQDFARTLKAMLILQAYEALVIGTAIVIVRRFMRLGDAFTLLVVELIILFDPTYFTNAFFTIPDIRGTLANVVWFALVPLKILVLTRFIHVKLNRWTFAGLTFAAFFVFLAEGPLNLHQTSLQPAIYFYVLAWMFPAHALMLPGLKRVIQFIPDSLTGSEPFVTPRQIRWLPLFITFIPLAIMLSHFIESSRIHEFLFYAFYTSPLLIAACVFYIKNRALGRSVHLLPVDGLCFLALILSYRVFNVVTDPIIDPPVHSIRHFIELRVPLLVCVIGIVLLYTWIYFSRNFKPAFHRIIAMSAFGSIYLFFSSGIPETIMGWGSSGVDSAVNWGDLMADTIAAWIRAYPAMVVVPIEAALLVLAYRFRKGIVWAICGTIFIWLFFVMLPGPRSAWAGEIIQSYIGLLLLLHHRFARKGRPIERYPWAAVIVIIGLVRLHHSPTAGFASLEMAVALTLIVCGYRLLHGGYILLGTIMFVWVPVFLTYRYNPVVFVFGCALTLFAVGILVSFRKQQILGALQSWEDKKVVTAFVENMENEKPRVPDVPID